MAKAARIGKTRRSATLASGARIIAIPTLVRQLPPSVRKIFGDPSNTERVMVGLNLVPVASPKRMSQ